MKLSQCPEEEQEYLDKLLLALSEILGIDLDESAIADELIAGLGYDPSSYDD